jgi:hypothetical protein
VTGHSANGYGAAWPKTREVPDAVESNDRSLTAALESQGLILSVMDVVTAFKKARSVDKRCPQYRDKASDTTSFFGWRAAFSSSEDVLSVGGTGKGGKKASIKAVKEAV